MFMSMSRRIVVDQDGMKESKVYSVAMNDAITGENEFPDGRSKKGKKADE
jgi:hypothetical protein